MCTVIYLPSKTGFILTSNRDESPLRRALPPAKFHENELEIVQPKDPLGGGTWLGYNSAGNFLVLLNGAFKRHPFGLTYRKSRGLIVSELLRVENPLRAWEKLDLSNIEPFTLVLFSENKLYQLVWDGTEKYCQKNDTQQAYIWSSTTLYDEIYQEKRRELFSDWLKQENEFSLEKVKTFLESYTDENNGFIMNRNSVVQTVSMTLIEKSGVEVRLRYIDLFTDDETKLESSLEL